MCFMNVSHAATIHVTRKEVHRLYKVTVKQLVIDARDPVHVTDKC